MLWRRTNLFGASRGVLNLKGFAKPALKQIASVFSVNSVAKNLCDEVV
jgi:hypothetical protein